MYIYMYIYNIYREGGGPIIITITRPGGRDARTVRAGLPAEGPGGGRPQDRGSMELGRGRGRNTYMSVDTYMYICIYMYIYNIYIQYE